MNDERKQARLAGLLYVLVALIAPYGLMVVPAKLLAPGDAHETALRIAANPGVLHLGMATELVHQAIEVFMVLVLYQLFAPVQRMLARQMLVLGLIPIPMVFLNVLAEVAAGLFADGPPWLHAFDRAQLDALALLAMQLHAHGLQLAAFFWGLWLLPLGLVMLRSGFIPKVIGACAIAASGGYVLGAGADILVPGLQAAVATPAFVLQVCEPVMILWLLLGGALRGRALASA
ncbi:MAG: DUF4386 domain-containing protein [Burkholderiaceae bacterium]|jgi:hypothetical protein